MSEIWRDIPDAGGKFVRYQISNLGNLRSIRMIQGAEGVIKPVKKFPEIRENKCVVRNTVKLPIKGGAKRYNFTVSLLVAKAFIPNPDNCAFLKHKNGNNLDDRADNLEWVTDTHKKYYFNFFVNDIPLAIGIKSETYDMALSKWQNALSKVIDFESTYGEIVKKDGKYYIGGKQIKMSKR